MTIDTRIVVWAFVLLLLSPAAFAAERLKPYVLGSISEGDFAASVDATRTRLQEAGFQVVGEYVPFPSSHILIATNDYLKGVAAKSENGGFAMAQRVSVVSRNGKVEVSYANPLYLAHAYRLGSDLQTVSDTLAGALGHVTEFGAKRGLKPEDLHEYNYTWGMEYFNETYKLTRYRSHREALAAVERHLKSNKQGVRPLYRIDMPGKDVSIIGVSMQAPDPQSNQKLMDDGYQMSVVDHGEYSAVAYLPYEIMISDRDVIALHMRFRAAVNFPSLRMVGKNSFFELSQSPEYIQKALTLAVGGEYEDPNTW